MAGNAFIPSHRTGPLVCVEETESPLYEPLDNRISNGRENPILIVSELWGMAVIHTVSSQLRKRSQEESKAKRKPLFCKGILQKPRAHTNGLVGSFPVVLSRKELFLFNS